MKRIFQFGCAVAALVVPLAAAQAAPAQRYFYAQRGQRPHPQAPRPAQMPKAQRQAQKQENKPGVRGAMGLPPKWMEKLQNMSPQEQARFMNNNRKFQSLPPQRQEQIRRRLQNWNQMTPQQRDAMRNREQIFNRLSPEQKSEVVDNLAPRWKALPQDRKELLTGRMRVLRGMTPEQRQQELQDPQFMRGLDENEQDLLRRLTDLRLGPSGPGQ